MVDPLKVLWVLTNSTYLVTKFIRTGTADKAENPPFFQQSQYEVDVEENVKLHTSILTVIASSTDPGARIRYEIHKGNEGGNFRIDSRSGVITTASNVDYEKRNKYELVVAAKDGQQEAQALVTVRVLDLNDNPPVFERPTYRTQIMEEDDRNLPKRILQVVAVDADKDRPRNIIYFLTGPGVDADNPANSKFDINGTTGEIFVLKALDRDPPHGRAQWRFTVFAHDEGGEGLVGYADVQLSLKDVNDNAPHFPRIVYWGNVTENGTKGMFVMNMTAVDYDDSNEGSNARLTYSIEKNVIDEDTGVPIFDIESKTGTIKTAICCLDRERTPDYAIQVVAMDGGGLKGTGTASIRIKDINDMPPHFTKEEWVAEVDETVNGILPETSILTVTVHDADEISSFRFKILENSGFGANKFLIVRNPDNTGSLKIMQPLDFEDPMQRNGFKFKIQVSDKEDADSYHKGYAWIVIKIRDINDNVPEFEEQNIEVSVLENTNVGYNIIQFRATDIDQSGNSQIQYSIDQQSDPRRQFHINQNGIVSLQRKLDREESKIHKISILAADDGVPPKTATATLLINVEDINDNAPVFLKEYRPVLPEHTPPQKIVEIQAKDKDDRLKNNGPPFTFKLDPTASDVIKSSFKVEYDPKGDGVAIVSSLRSFDREQQKEYHIPMIIKDSGKPTMTGTNTLTVVIGDFNDNKMQPGSKEILVYNYMGQTGDMEIGRVHVQDKDDWDLPDKTFFWDGMEHPRFKLDEDSGMIILRHGTLPNRYILKFRVNDKKHSQSNIPANVSVTVKNIPYEAVINSGSIRISGLTDEEFVKIWHYDIQKVFKSKLELLQEYIARILNIVKEKVDIFSVQLYQKSPPMTDIHFSARSSTYFKPERLNGIILFHREKIEKELNINITMIGIDECLYENNKCEGSCTNRLEIGKQPYLVNANMTSLVGVHLSIITDCVCEAHNQSHVVHCHYSSCYNRGQCVQENSGVSCICEDGYNGPRCQQTVRSFWGTGWAWYQPLSLCDNSHLSLEFISRKSDGLLLYNGPIVPPEVEESLVSDFISLELENGMPRLLIDFGSGTLQLRVRTKQSLDDGEWHRLDIIWDTKKVSLVVDFCKSADISEDEDEQSSEFNYTNCLVTGIIPPFNEYLNVNTPLQIGGLYAHQIDPTYYHWQFTPVGKSFDGCIKNVFYNNQIYDLAEPGLSKNSQAGCPQAETLCNSKDLIFGCEEHGTCESSFNDAWCKCEPGWTGFNCLTPTIPATFKMHSYVKYALSFEPDLFSTNLQLRFRTREKEGELFRISDQHNKEYCILEIKDGHLQFRYNLNSIITDEKCVSLSSISVNDGKWHTAKVSRYGSAVMLQMDGGEGSWYNETFLFEGHQLLTIDKQEGIYAGGKAEYIGVRTFEVQSDYNKGCMDDIVLEGKHLPLPPAMNGTQWGQATMAQNLERNCLSNNSCSNVTCPDPLECIDLWNEYECNCGDGWLPTNDKRDCNDKNECFDKPCQNGGTCINQEPPHKYHCLCHKGYWGRNCELAQRPRSLKLSIEAFVIIASCLLIIFVFVLVFFCFNHRKIVKKKPPALDDVRENIISYNDEGGGEDDMTVFDMKPLQVPVSSAETVINADIVEPKSDENIWSNALEKCAQNAEIDPNILLPDDLRNYAFEGGGSTSGSLSSLASSTEESVQDFGYIFTWGPKFVNIANIYSKRDSKSKNCNTQDKNIQSEFTDTKF